MTQPLNPDRLHLRKLPNTATYFIVWRQRRIGQVQSEPILTKDGFVTPNILLEKKFSQQLVERIKDLVNKMLNANHDLIVNVPPSIDHPFIQDYFLKQKIRW